MHAYVRRALCAVGLTGGVVLLGIGLAEAASADGASGPVTSGESGIVSGNQTGANVQAPVNLSGNQVTVIGQDNKTTSTGSSSSTSSGSSGSPTTSGENGIGSGNQTAVGAQVPVNATGNQVTVIGQDNKVASTGSSSSGSSSGASGSPTTSGEDGIGSGNQTAVDLRIPVNVSGNQITVIGQDNTTDASGSSSTGTPAGASSGGATTTGESGILSGNQTGIGVQLPVNASGNQVTVIGQDNVVDSTGSSTTGGSTGGSTGPTTSGEDGFGSGNQTGVGVTAPITATGNQVTVIGQDNTLTSTGTTTTGGSTGPGGTTTGEGGGGSGNQTPIDVQAPVDTSGNQVTVIGQDNTDTSTSGSTSGGTTPGGSTPPGGTVVSPPSTGSGTGSGTQAASAPGDSALPNTGAPAGLLGAGLLGLLLVLLGGAILRREEAMV